MYSSYLNPSLAIINPIRLPRIQLLKRFVVRLLLAGALISSCGKEIPRITCAPYLDTIPYGTLDLIVARYNNEDVRMNVTPGSPMSFSINNSELTWRLYNPQLEVGVPNGLIIAATDTEIGVSFTPAMDDRGMIPNMGPCVQTKHPRVVEPWLNF